MYVLKEAFEMTDMTNKFIAGVENLGAMSMTKASAPKKILEPIDLAKIFGKRGVTCG